MRLLEPIRLIALAGLLGLLGAGALMGALYLGNPMDKVFVLVCLLGIAIPFVKDLERFSFLAIGGTLPIMLTIHFTQMGINRTRSHNTAGFVVTVTEVLILILLAHWAKRVLVDKAPVRIFPKITLPTLFGFFIAIAASIRTIDDPNAGLWMLYQILLGVGVFLYLLNNPRPQKDYIAFAWIVGGMLVFQSFLGHMQWLFHTSLGLEPFGASMVRVERVKGTVELSRMVGTLANANRFGGYVSLFMAFPLALFVSQVRKKQRWLLLFILAAAFFALVGSKSRGSWFSTGLVYGVALFLIFRTRMRVSRAVIAYAWGIFILLIGIAFSPGVIERLTIADAGSVDARFYMNQIASNLIMDNPWLGVGYDNYTLFFHHYDNTDIGHSFSFPFIIHNGYLYTAAEYGLPMLFILGLVWWRVFRYSFRLRPRSLHPLEMLAWILPFAFLARSIQILFYISNPFCSVPLWFFLGMMVALREKADAIAEEAEPSLAPG